jgi:hypothetical protein
MVYDADGNPLTANLMDYDAGAASCARSRR